jgi:hypothetical protein
VFVSGRVGLPSRERFVLFRVLTLVGIVVLSSPFVLVVVVRDLGWTRVAVARGLDGRRFRSSFRVAEICRLAAVSAVVYLVPPVGTVLEGFLGRLWGQIGYIA